MLSWLAAVLATTCLLSSAPISAGAAEARGTSSGAVMENIAYGKSYTFNIAFKGQANPTIKIGTGTTTPEESQAKPHIFY